MKTAIVRSSLESDLYKSTMQQVMLHQMPQNEAVYRFVCRNKPAFPLSELVNGVNEQLDILCSLQYTEQELEFFKQRDYFKSDYIDFLRLFKFQRNYITAKANGEFLEIEARGPQVHVMGFEIHVLYIVSELYMQEMMRRCGGVDAVMVEMRARLRDKINWLKAQNLPETFSIMEMGLRRRASAQIQEEVLQMLCEELPQHVVGTSNCYLAHKYNLKAYGTMAHEFLQTYQAMPNVQLRYSIVSALDAWVREYRGKNGIALTDVITSDAFFKDFDLFFAKLFDGLRHDSGDPIEWGNKAIAHFESLHIDPKTKQLVFSDGLNFQKAVEIFRYFEGRAKMSFGIGTWLCNDIGITPLNLVMKVVNVNGKPVAKISDAPGKTICDDKIFLDYLKQTFNVL